VIEPESYEIINALPIASSQLIHTGRIIPVYSEKKQLSSRIIREKIFWLINQLNSLDESLPERIISYNNLIGLLPAYKNIHYPASKALVQAASRRLAFDELFSLQLKILLTKRHNEKEINAPRIVFDDQKRKIINDFINNLPFNLTNDQLKSLKEIFSDLTAGKSMNRFLQGDVGSGKTVVATIACFLTYLNGFQSLIMAPTEILANQHYQTINKLFLNFESQTTNIKSNPNYKIPKILLITGTTKKTFHQSQVNNYDIIIGTHALLNKNLKFKKIGLVVIDEQHRFGVSQRTQLKNKRLNSHLLTMTATPIPRTVALTLYGDLDFSSIFQMPKGRQPIKTFLIPQNKRADGYNWIKNEIKNKKIQVFIICPLIEESDKETMKSVKAAEKEYQYLKTKIFNDFKLALLHGRLKTVEKNKIMSDFKNKLYDILVSTPVVEVGVDIPNATVMIIEAAERYGLAQLHQLRGRVGRGQLQAYCFLFTEKDDKNVINRLNFFAKSSSGIKLAEYDLKHRGPGEIYGTKQHGFIDLKIAKLTDYELIKQAKNAALYFTHHYQLENFSILKKSVEKYRLKQFSNN